MGQVVVNSRQATRRRPVQALVVIVLLAVIAGGVYLAYQYLWAWYHASAAERAGEHGDFRAEYQHRKKSLEVWSKSGQMHFLGARAARRSGALQDAEELLAKSAKLGWIPQAIQQEQLLLRLQGGNRDLDPEELLACARTMDKGNPDLALLLESVTKSYLLSYRLREVQECLNLWLERDHESIQALLYRGWVLTSLAQTDAALADYRQAVALQPDHEAARLRLAETLLEAKKPEEALEHFQWLERWQPDNPPVVLGLALCRRDLGESAEAQKLLERLLDAERVRLVRELSDSLRASRPPGKEIEAAEWFRQAVAVAPYELRLQPQYVVSLYVTALVERSRLAMADDENARAESWLRQALQLDPYDYQAMNQFAYCLERLGSKDEAQKYRARLGDLRADRQALLELTGKVTENPRDPSLRCEAGKILLHNGRPKEGLRWLYSALRENPLHGPTHEALANYYDAVGQSDKAAHHRQQAARAGDGRRGTSRGGTDEGRP